MPATVLEQHYRDRMQSARQLTWQSLQQFALHQAAGHTERAGFVVGDLVVLCSDLAEAGQQLLEREYRHIFEEPDVSVAWLQERRRALEELSDSFLELARSLKNSVAQAYQAAGWPTRQDTVARLDDAVQRIVSARQKVLQSWPVGSDQEIAEARTGGPEQDYLEPDEAFAQIAGVDVADWRLRMEKYRRPRQD